MPLNPKLMQFEADAINDGDWSDYGYPKEWADENRETARAFKKAYRNAMKHGLSPEQYDWLAGYDADFGDPVVQALHRNDPSLLPENRESRLISPIKPGKALPVVAGSVAAAPFVLSGLAAARRSPKMALGFGGAGAAVGALVAKKFHDADVKDYERRLKNPVYSNSEYNEALDALRKSMA